jgi:signal transduction histidine kinase
LRSLLSILLCLLAFPLKGHGTAVLRTIPEVLALSTAEAAQSQPVDLTATVTFDDPTLGVCSVSDGRAGIFLKRGQQSADQPALSPGDRVRILGVSDPGQFMPVIAVKKLEVLGSGPPLEPRSMGLWELSQENADAAWVEFTTTVAGTSQDERGRSYLSLRGSNAPLRAYLTRIEHLDTPPWELAQRQVRMRCVVATIYNEDRQICGHNLYVPGLSFITTLTTISRPGLAPLRCSDELLTAERQMREYVRLRGIVTQVRPGQGLILRDEGGSLFIETAQPMTDFQVGDRVQAFGYPSIQRFRPKLATSRVEHLGTGWAPEPLNLDPNSKRSSREQYELVKLRAQLADFHTNATHTILTCTANKTRFEAWLKNPLHQDLRPGAQLELQGICELSTTDAGDRLGTATSFLLRLRDETDLQVLALPSWWTAPRLIWLAASAATVASMLTLWAWMLKRKIREQADIIRLQTQQEATLEERHRIARELHDTLEQDLMGVNMLLDDTAEKLSSADAHAARPLEMARLLLNRSREESRSTIRDLRSVALEQMGLSSALEQSLPALAVKAGVRVELSVPCPIQRLPISQETHLYRICHEAVGNALRHAKAKLVKVTLQSSAQQLSLEVSDDGCGFDPAENHTRTGHFGLQGIRERVNQLGAKLDLQSSPQTGTSLRVLLSSPA